MPTPRTGACVVVSDLVSRALPSSTSDQRGRLVPLPAWQRAGSEEDAPAPHRASVARTCLFVASTAPERVGRTARTLPCRHSDVAVCRIPVLRRVVLTRARCAR